MKPSKWEFIAWVVIWGAIAVWYLADLAPPIGPERIEGMRAAWASCDAPAQEKREVAARVKACLLKVAAYLENDGKLDKPEIKTAQQAARLRFTYAKNALAGTGFCGAGCKFQAPAQLSSDYLKRHLGVATDYKLDEPFQNNKQRTARAEWCVVLKNLALGIEEGCP